MVETPALVEIWYHVVFNDKAWGFASKDGFVTKTPQEYSYWKGYHLSQPELRSWFVEQSAKIYKVAEAYL